VEPALVPGTDGHCQQQSQNPHHDQAGSEDDLAQQPYPLRPQGGFIGPGAGGGKVDHLPRQHEKASEPEHHENDVSGLEPEIGHGKEEFSIMGDMYCPTCNQEIKERTKIIAKCDTGDLAYFAKEAELLPGTSYEFYLDKKLIAKFNMDYSNSEMSDVNPTIEDFEVKNESYKEIIVRGIEERVERQGFVKIWLTNYIGYPPETDFWRKMEYEFDIDEGYKEFY